MPTIGDLEVEVGADISEFNRKMNSVQRTIVGLGKGANDVMGSKFWSKRTGLEELVDTRGGLAMLFPLIAAAGHAAGIAAAGVGALASQLTAATLGLGGYTAVAIPAIAKLFELKEAIDNGEKSWSDLTDAQHEAIHALEDFQSFYSEFSGQFEGDVLEGFILSLEALEALMLRLEPAIGPVAETMNELIRSFTEALDSEDMVEFFKFVEETAAPALDNLTRGVGNFIAGFLNMMEEFGPLGEEFGEGFLDMSRKFRKWADTLDENQEFQEFIDYVKENGPDMLDDLGSIMSNLLRFGEVLMEIGDPILDFLAWLSDIHTAMMDYGEIMDEGVIWTKENWNEIEDFLESLDWSSLLFDLGKNLMTGFLDGMKSMWGELVDAAHDMADAARKAAMRRLDMHSPSRVFMKIGAYTGEGMAIGMDDSVGMIEDSARSMADVSVQGVSSHLTGAARSDFANVDPDTGEVQTNSEQYAIINIGGYEARGIIQFITDEQRREQSMEERAAGI